MKNSVIYILMLLLLVSCGSDKIAGISIDSPKETAAVSEPVSAKSILSELEKGKYREGELLVKFRAESVKTASAKVHQRIGASVVRKFQIVSDLEHIKLPAGLSIKDAIVQYMNDPAVEYAEPNYIRKTKIEPNDTLFPQQWSLYNLGTVAGATQNADIRGPFAWDVTKGSSTLVVAVLDTGIDYTHPDLVGNMWVNSGETNCVDGIDNDGNGFIDDCKGWNSADDTNDPMDDNGHGTFVSGIIGATGNNGLGIAGVMWHVRLMAVKFIHEDGSGTIADEVAAIQYAVANGARIINASYGDSTFSNTERDAIISANTAGVLFVAAAGNDGTNNDLYPMYPANYSLPNIISVAATDQNDRLAAFSNFGPNTVHVAAPGVFIMSTLPTWLKSFPGFGVFERFDGTSLAAPHVSGLAGLLYSYYPHFTLSQIRSTILRYVDKEGDGAPELQTLTATIQSRGRINAYKAVSSLQTPTNLNATALSFDQVSLTWNDNATGENGYRVERKTASTDFVQITSLGPNSNSYTNTGLSASTEYIYRVTAFNTIPANSAASNVAAVTTPSQSTPPPPVDTGDGGCSIGARKNTPTALADLMVLLIPVLFIALLRRKGRN